MRELGLNIRASSCLKFQHPPHLLNYNLTKTITEGCFKVQNCPCPEVLIQGQNWNFHPKIHNSGNLIIEKIKYFTFLSIAVSSLGPKERSSTYSTHKSSILFPSCDKKGKFQKKTFSVS